VLNSLVAARTMTGRDGHVSRAIDLDELCKAFEESRR